MSVHYILVIYVGGYIHVSYFDSHKRYRPVLKPSHQRVGLPCFIPMVYCPTHAQGTAGKLIHISEMTFLEEEKGRSFTFRMVLHAE